MSIDTRPLAVYTDLEDMEFSAGIALLEENGYRVEYLATEDPEEIIQGARGAEALLISYARLTASMMDALPDLKIISLCSMGTDQVDVNAARERGIWVTALPGVSAEEVATHALAMALSVVRELPFFHDNAARGNWLARPDAALPRLSEQRLGLIGLGRIGSRVGAIASPLFGEVIAYDPYLPETAQTAASLERDGIRRTSLEEVLSTSTVVSLHVPLTEATHHLIDAEALATMRPGSVLVNVSRGKLVDSYALRDAIDNGHLRGAALDVLETEPAPQGHPLIGHPKVLVTPHVAFLSERSHAEYIRIQAQNVITLRNTGTPDTPLFDAAQGRTKEPVSE
ncbi:C-terminal binding protein [Arthrobacter sp. StoSoilB5]|uniref:C-terminal binding protein n=1 Tax=Arthrobacter sp. StoSoilB5 TaxID=2830992 RepID=UPI001CC3CE37|nr:C-terminal binding protein [Arthrobacter sp. StoSoilB5]BCW44859.1 hypothetical protein StoSoilB5_20430 [Arthrobacter sp. StoSoilB5]